MSRSWLEEAAPKLLNSCEAPLFVEGLIVILRLGALAGDEFCGSLTNKSVFMLSVADGLKFGSFIFLYTEELRLMLGSST